MLPALRRAITGGCYLLCILWLRVQSVGDEYDYTYDSVPAFLAYLDFSPSATTLIHSYWATTRKQPSQGKNPPLPL